MRISHLRGLAQPMKCDIAIKHPYGRPWFTVGDVVGGAIKLELKKDVSITSVVVSLTGKSPIALTPQGGPDAAPILTRIFLLCGRPRREGHDN